MRRRILIAALTLTLGGCAGTPPKENNALAAGKLTAPFPTA